MPQWPVDATPEAAEKSMGFFEQTVAFRVVPLYAAPIPMQRWLMGGSA